MTRVTIGMLFASAMLLMSVGRLTGEESGGAPACGCGAKKGCDCDDNKCDVCGCHANCNKICRLIKGTKKVSKTCYDCKCEDFCIPGPSKLCGVCWVNEKDPCTGCVKCVRKENWQPSDCAQVRTKHMLVKREVSKEVPAYKWEVQKVCRACACKCMAEDRQVPASMIANDKSEAEQAESVDEVQQASASEPAERADVAPAPGPTSPAMIVKAKLMSLLGK
jgi:hypothetical protein